MEEKRQLAEQNLQQFHSFSLPATSKGIYFCETQASLLQQWQWAVAQQLPVLILGGGSNVLFTTNFNGVVLINRLLGKQYYEDQDFHYVQVQAGENWHQLVQWSLAQGIYGLENLALIPGSVGAAPIQNIGAYGVEFKEVCHYVDVLNLHNGERFRLTQAQCEFGYRESIFKHQYAQGYVIVAVGLKLAKQWTPKLHYAGLRELAQGKEPGDSQSAVSAQDIFARVCALRQAKLPDPTVYGNAGSFFKNPVVSAEQFHLLQQTYPTIPYYPQADGRVKLAAGWLIDQCGLKGYQIGGAAVHQQQALVLINKQNATGQDVVALAREVRQQVAQRFALWLQPEVRFIGAQGEINSEQAIA